LKNAAYRTRFRTLNNILTIKDGTRSVALCHYPLYAFEGSTKGGYHVFGHIHNNLSEPMYDILSKLPNYFNAGVDVNGFVPVTLDNLIERKRTMIQTSC